MKLALRRGMSSPHITKYGVRKQPIISWPFPSSLTQTLYRPTNRTIHTHYDGPQYTHYSNTRKLDIEYTLTDTLSVNTLTIDLGIQVDYELSNKSK